MGDFHCILSQLDMHTKPLATERACVILWESVWLSVTHSDDYADWKIHTLHISSWVWSGDEVLGPDVFELVWDERWISVESVTNETVCVFRSHYFSRNAVTFIRIVWGKRKLFWCVHVSSYVLLKLDDKVVHLVNLQTAVVRQSVLMQHATIWKFSFSIKTLRCCLRIKDFMLPIFTCRYWTEMPKKDFHRFPLKLKDNPDTRISCFRWACITYELIRLTSALSNSSM